MSKTDGRIRVGRSVGRTIYDDQDRLIGVMDTREDASEVVARWNAFEDGGTADELLACLVDLLPCARKYLLELNKKMIGDLYPAINVGRIERAEAVINKIRGE